MRSSAEISSIKAQIAQIPRKCKNKNQKLVNVCNNKNYLQFHKNKRI